MRFRVGDVIEQKHNDSDKKTYFVVTKTNKDNGQYSVYWIEKCHEINDWFHLADNPDPGFGFTFKKVEGWI